jgi:multiple sugar transport system substrate-binding protein
MDARRMGVATSPEPVEGTMTFARSELSRRRVLGSAIASGAAGILPWAGAHGQAGEAVNFIAWSAVVDQVRAHITGFERAHNVRVNYENHPAAQFRATLVQRITANAPIDVMWMNDAWGPEFAEAGWVVPINDIPRLMALNSDVSRFCINYMTWKDKQYGTAYYGDHMAFMYNQELLERAGITRPPQTWDEVVSQSLQIKQRGVVEFPLSLSLAADAWLIEMFSAVAFSFGGRFALDDGTPVMHDPARGVTQALKWLQDAIHVHKIASPASANQNEIPGLRAFSSGSHAFGIIPRYRIRSINDPAQSQIPGKARIALMPTGGNHREHNTVGWMRFFGLRPRARQNAQRQENVVKFLEWFTGTTSGGYNFQRMLILDAGVPYCVPSMDRDPDITAFWDRWGGQGAREVVTRQAMLAMPKDTVTPWFGEWNEANNQALQAAILNRATPEAAMRTSLERWNALKS